MFVSHSIRKQAAGLLAGFVCLLPLILSPAVAPVAAYQEPVPTLIPPTLVPTVETGMVDALPSESTLARIVNDGRLRVGTLYNEPPFGELNLRGDVSGFDADLARALGEVWGVEVDLIQVTRQTAIDMLLTGQVDLLLAALVHRRELDSVVEFSQMYYPGVQMMLVREGDGAAVLDHMEGRKVGVVMGTRGERAVDSWLQGSGLNVTVEQYLTLDQALSALRAQEVDGVVESRIRLTRAITEPGVFRFVDDPVAQEPYAIVMRRQDVNLRNLVNRSLQFLVSTGRMNEIYQAHFEGAAYPIRNFPVWNNLGEEGPTPGQFSTDIPFPAQYVVPRLQAEGVVRVSGVADVPEDADESVRRFDAVNRALVEAMASRWGVQVQYIPNSTENALDLVASGEADLAVGVQADWDWADRVDFTSSYLLHGHRLMVHADEEIGGFADLRGEIIGIFATEPGISERMVALAEEERALVDVFILVNEEDAAIGMLAQNNYDAVFGDSMKLVYHIQNNPEDLTLVTNEDGGWYSRTYRGFAVPRNDIDFRLLVEYTLQELARDGQLTTLLNPVMLPEDMPEIAIWPGQSDYLGISLLGG